MTENLAKLPAKGILRKSSLTFIEHDDSEIQIKMEAEKPTKVIVEPPLQTPPKEYEGETEEERARREEFEYKRKLYRHQEGMSVQLAKRLLSQEEDIEEEADPITEVNAISIAGDDVPDPTPAEGNDESSEYCQEDHEDVTVARIPSNAFEPSNGPPNGQHTPDKHTSHYRGRLERKSISHTAEPHRQRRILAGLTSS